MKTTTIVLAFLVAWAFAVPTGWTQTSQDKEHAELAKALRDAKIPLQRGLTASAKEASRFPRSTRSRPASSSCPFTR